MTSNHTGEPAETNMEIQSPAEPPEADKNPPEESSSDDDTDELLAQLSGVGPIGLATAAAIKSAQTTGKSRRFEVDPTKRKRQQTKLLKRIHDTLQEFMATVGKQAVLLVATPGKTQGFKVFGAQPLQDVVRGLKTPILEGLEGALAQQPPAAEEEDPMPFELPALVADGIPTPLEKMTQVQLRAFIPLMLKYSTGRGKPRWGQEASRPAWWPQDVPWASVRMDSRSEEEKKRVPWTKVLRNIITNCYKHHGREDLLQLLKEEPENAAEEESAGEKTAPPILFHTIPNLNGTLSIVQVDPNTQYFTLPDGSTAHVQKIAIAQPEHCATTETQPTTIQINTERQLILTGQDGCSYAISAALMTHLQANGCDVGFLPETGANCEENHNEIGVMTQNGLTGQPVMLQSVGGETPQLLQVLSFNGVTELEAMQGTADFKTEETAIGNQ